LTDVQHDGVESAATWLMRLVEARTLLGKPLVLNVAGPRESESPGVYVAAIELIGRILDRVGS
jgi:hypothetical protein